MKDKDVYNAIGCIRNGLIQVAKEQENQTDYAVLQMTEALIESIFLLIRVIQERPLK